MLRNICKSLIIGGLIGLATNNSSLAGENIWTSEGPYGARVFAIAIHPFNNQIIYIGTIENGIYKSTNGGADWFHLDNNLLTEAMRVIRIHPFGPDTVYASTANGVFKSTDAGASWSRFDPFTSEYRALAIHPRNPAIMMIGGLGMYYKTTDGGNSWSENICGQVIQDIIFDPSDSNRVYRATQSPFTGHSIYRSDNLGDNWVCIHNDLDSLGFVQDMALDPVGPLIVYLAEHSYLDSIPRCLSKTTNGGQHWIDITPADLRRPYVYCIAISPFNHNTLYICTDMDGVLKSTDGGISWQRKNNGLNVNMVERIVVDSTTGLLYLGTYWDGIYRSSNGGDSWEKISYHIPHGECLHMSINDNYPDSIYAATAAGLSCSINGAHSWEPVDIGIIGINATTADILVDQDSRLIFVGLAKMTIYTPNAGFARSIDGGVNWEIVNSDPIGHRSASELAISYADTSRRIFFASDSGLYFSDDIGLTWSICHGGLPALRCGGLDVSTANSSLVFVSRYWPEPSIFYKSTDRGETWNQLEGIPSGGYSLFIKCDPLDSNVVYVDAGLRVGLYKSTDCGLTWFETNNNLPRDEDYFDITGMGINPLNSNEILATSFNKGVFISYDGGANWNPFSDGLQYFKFGAADIEFNPLDTSKIIMSTLGASVWSIHRTLVGVEDNAPVLPEKIILSNYPNPFNSQTIISYSLPRASNVTIDIFDISGRKLETLFSAHKEAGEHTIVWNTRDAASGVYFYRIKAGKYSGVKICVLLR